MKTLADLGVELCRRRKALGKTQAEVAALSGLTQDKLSRMERGQLPGLTVSKLLAVAQVLGLDPVLAVVDRPSRPTLETLLAEQRRGANTGPGAR